MIILDLRIYKTWIQLDTIKLKLNNIAIALELRNQIPYLIFQTQSNQ